MWTLALIWLCQAWPRCREVLPPLQVFVSFIGKKCNFVPLNNAAARQWIDNGTAVCLLLCFHRRSARTTSGCCWWTGTGCLPVVPMPSPPSAPTERYEEHFLDCLIFLLVSTMLQLLRRMMVLLWSFVFYSYLSSRCFFIIIPVIFDKQQWVEVWMHCFIYLHVIKFELDLLFWNWFIQYIISKPLITLRIELNTNIYFCSHWTKFNIFL